MKKIFAFLLALMILPCIAHSMIILDATTRKVQIVLAGAITTNQLPFVASYVDVTTTTYTPGSNNGTTNNTIAVDMVAAPGASTQRQIKLITVRNADTATATVSLLYNDNGTTRELCKVTLLAGYELVYTDGDGFRVMDNSGNLLYSTSGAVSSVTASSPIASTGGTTPDISIQNAAADGATKGAATFTANDFEATGGNVSLDYTNGQSASGSTKGFLTSADWTTFNNKQDGLVTGNLTASAPISLNNTRQVIGGAAAISISQAGSGSNGYLSSTDWTTFNGKVSSVGATNPITSSGGTTPTISTSIATNKLVGRGTAGTGVMEEITLGTYLSYTGTTLNVAEYYPSNSIIWTETMLSTSGTWILFIDVAQKYNAILYNSTGADGNALSMGFHLKAGTYTVAILGRTQNNAGKIDWTIDGSSIATAQDWYSASTTNNVVKTIASVVVSGNGFHTMTATINGKNASSAGYFFVVTNIAIYPASYSQDHS